MDDTEPVKNIVVNEEDCRDVATKKASKVLALDLSSSTGFSYFIDGKLVEYGKLPKVFIEDFNVNSKPPPNKSKHYPKNIMNAAVEVAYNVNNLIERLKPDHIVIENTVKARNAHTQRFLEWLHLRVLEVVMDYYPFTYILPSEWRKALEIRLSKDDKIKNKAVKAGKIKGKVGKKHLSVRYVNETFSLKLKLKDNDVADSICLGHSYFVL